MSWELSIRDRELFENELQAFIPEKIYDSYVHLYEREYFAAESPAWLAEAQDFAGWKTYRQSISLLFPARQVSGLCFGFPLAGGDVNAANCLVANEVRQAPDAGGQMLIRRDMDPE